MLSLAGCKHAPVCRPLLCCTLLQVRICKERATGKIFAMKKLKKTEMVRRGQVSSLAHSLPAFPAEVLPLGGQPQ